MPQEWITVEFIGGPLDGALRSVQLGYAVYRVSLGSNVVHDYTLSHEAERYVMRHTVTEPRSQQA